MADHNEGAAPLSHAAAPVPVRNQTLRKGLLLLAVCLAFGFLLIGDSRWSNTHWVHEGLEWVGIGLIVVCIVGRTWASLYIGGRKSQTLITHGPYSMTRNPLYLFSIIGAAGVGAQMGSFVTALVGGFIAWAVFLWVARHEEAVLVASFGNAYRHYCAKVSRFWPNPSLWRSPETIEVHPRVVVSTFADALIFLAAVPLAEGLEYLHEIGTLPVLLLLP